MLSVILWKSIRKKSENGNLFRIQRQKNNPNGAAYRSYLAEDCRRIEPSGFRYSKGCIMAARLGLERHESGFKGGVMIRGAHSVPYRGRRKEPVGSSQRTPMFGDSHRN